MKKIFSLVMATVLLSALLCACRKKEGYLDLSKYGENFRHDHESLFFNEECEHFLVYTGISVTSGTVDANSYHAVKCNKGNCGYSEQYEPHVLKISYLKVTDTPKYMENGYLYHRVVTDCRKCGFRVILYVYCPLQEKECTADGQKNECLAGCDWGELLCDTPYVISYD